ncbi:MAG: class II fructose-bisphosphate aldolase [Caldicoprobacter sp.]|uniref:class II fructose-bisphosphate aldolase n=1 Tax=Caldicoprobacter sp. TaxID=2004500 RepID=UPI0039C2D7B7
MPLVNPLKFIKKAQEKGVAIAAFNVHNLETIQAVVEAAAEERAPVIVQTTPGTLKHAGIEYISACVKVAAELYDIPIALHVDHCPSYKTIVQCIRNGYTSVMIDGSELPYEENVALVKKVVELAHSVGVAVEGELGRIGGAEDGITVEEREATFTVPEEAKAFVDATGVDTLAVAIGTAHGVYKWEPKLDFKRLSDIRKLVDVPLVLHGASGVDDDSIKRAIAGGICKINIATELKIPMAKAIQAVFQFDPEENDPRNYMGAAKKAVKEVVRRKIRLCGCNGLADELEGYR